MVMIGRNDQRRMRKEKLRQETKRELQECEEVEEMEGVVDAVGGDVRLF